MKNLPQQFGSMVFNDAVMRERLSSDIYAALRKTIKQGTHLELDVANAVANAMKDWAVEKGATHFTHWFQPMTGITAEKHDSFIEPEGNDKIMMCFSGKALVKGEPDASSFPSGGLRATFEARGYTAWDPTSNAFIKDNVLCIPTAFCSYSGEALDNKTPLLRSMEALDKQALRVLKLFGKTDVKRVIAQIGPEQEYFLVDKEVFNKRPDLLLTGRTLFGARPSKGQEMEDHYFGVIKQRVSAFMKELDETLWSLGILSKTEHNEVAPAQHELAPIYSTANIATDHNQLTMELMKTIANKHGLVCLLHEKPFAGVNGSGKHNNWSISTDTGHNLLDPGATPHDNAQFLLFLVAVIKAVDDYQDLLRMSVATAGNDHRLGASEAPPAIVSIFLGDELSEILEAIVNNTQYVGKEKVKMEIGATVLPHFAKDTTDRNRTSPFAFTGNKFEFRMPGSTVSISGPNVVLNTIVAETLKHFADQLEKSTNFNADLSSLIKNTIKNHKRIIFNGNGYDDAWVVEAEKRGLENLKDTPAALQTFIRKKNIKVFTDNKVLSSKEVKSRYEISLETYCKTINIEALTMIDLVNKYILPDVLSYESTLVDLLTKKKALGTSVSSTAEEKLLSEISKLADKTYKALGELESAAIMVRCENDMQKQAEIYHKKVLSSMNQLRTFVDSLELIIGKNYWTLPTYSDLLYSVLD